ncbi:MAG TPA: hypothetical protein VGX24_05485 [Pyrinomonadaceae bacterium]|jgi:hypothetical protein|nr:hypothetical protein [Pyrinomonadaceae bacterium]
MENAASQKTAPAVDATTTAAAGDYADAADKGAEARSKEKGRRNFLASAAVVRAAYLAAGALAVGFVFWWLQFSTDAICCGDLDGYYHIGWSQQLRQSFRAGHILPQFIWLPLTTLNARDYVDHHFLFHVLQIPFTFFADVRTGAKISAWLFASLAVFSCYWLIVRHRIKYPLMWLVALLGCSAPFLFRMNMTKAMSVSLVLLVLGIHLLFQRKYLWLLPLAFIFTLTYDMFVLLGLAAVIWTAVVAWSERRFEWRPLVWVAVGVAAGTVINPYFPHNVRLLYAHIAMKVTAREFSTAVGQEWYPYDSWDFARNCGVAFAAMFAGYVAFNWQDRKRAARALFFLVFSTILLVVNARWRRFAEYWPPFAVLFAAFTLQLVFERARTAYGALPADVLDELEPYLDRPATNDAARGATEGGWTEAQKTFAAAIVTVLLTIPMVSMIVSETREISTTAPHEQYTKGIDWMRTHVPAGQVIFNTDWDDFPKLFYYDPTHAYVSGLDPTYLYDRDKSLSRLYEDITLGRHKDPGPVIRERFGARYVFTDNEDVHNDFYDAAMDSGWFDEVYADKDCTVLYIRDQKGTPPPVEPDDDTANPDDAPGEEEEEASDGANET